MKEQRIASARAGAAAATHENAAGSLLDDRLQHPEGATTKPTATPDPGLIGVPAFELPSSYFLDPTSQLAVHDDKDWIKRCSVKGVAETVERDRRCLQRHFFEPLLEKLTKRYQVCIQRERIADVNVEVITSAQAMRSSKETPVLINLHGGAFMYGEVNGGRIESIPLAAVGGFKVISVDYRMAPEHQFPAASDDAVSVYEALLKDHRAESIGIYGCSAGAVLSAQTVAQLQKRRSALPGAIGMFGGAAHPFHGDSFYITRALLGMPVPPKDDQRASADKLYGKHVRPDDPAFYPGTSAEILARFPPSLLIASTRDIGLSAVAATHTQLVKLGVTTELHVWEGVGHCFHYNPELAASLEAYEVMVRFFKAHLDAH